jgi:regulatory protein YycH of two-component signal transduction system YycFG
MYKQWTAIRSVLSFLREDKLMEIKIDREYEDTLKNDQNLANIDVKTHKIIKIDTKSNTTKISKEKGKVITLLENIALEYSSKIPFQYFKDVRLNIGNFFEVDLIKRIIRHNEEKLGLKVLYL